MNGAEFMKVGHTRYNFRKLTIIDKENSGGNSNQLTNCKRFALGLDFVYCITFPLGIHSERMQKQDGFVGT